MHKYNVNMNSMVSRLDIKDQMSRINVKSLRKVNKDLFKIVRNTYLIRPMD